MRDGKLGKAKDLTQDSLDSGLIPRVCPVCKSPVNRLAIHHWNCPTYRAFELGLYRRICHSCNLRIGRLFDETVGLPTWETQRKALLDSLGLSLETTEEGGWGLFTQDELDRILSIPEKTEGRVNYKHKSYDVVTLREEHEDWSLERIAEKTGLSREGVRKILLKNKKKSKYSKVTLEEISTQIKKGHKPVRLENGDILIKIQDVVQ